MKKYIKYIKNNYKSLFIIAFVVVMFLFLNQCKNTKKWKHKFNTEQQENKQNLIAMKNEIREYKNKNNINTFSSAIAIMSKEELKLNFPDLYNRMKDEFGEVQYVTNTVIQYVDSSYVSNSVIELSENHYAIQTNYTSNDSNLYIESLSKFYAEIIPQDADKSKVDLKITNDTTEFKKIYFRIDLTTGIKKDEDGIYKIFVTPNNKHINIVKLIGADVSEYFQINDNTISSTTKRWTIGPYIGYGIMFAKNNAMYHGLTVGASVQYSLIRF